MIVPNKVTFFEDSIISKMLFLLDFLRQKKEGKVSELFLSHADKFDGVEEFIYSIDVLFLLDAIEFDIDSGVVRYVERNPL